MKRKYFERLRRNLAEGGTLIEEPREHTGRTGELVESLTDPAEQNEMSEIYKTQY
jgi:hypothetical protein